MYPIRTIPQILTATLLTLGLGACGADGTVSPEGNAPEVPQEANRASILTAVQPDASPPTGTPPAVESKPRPDEVADVKSGSVVKDMPRTLMPFGADLNWAPGPSAGNLQADAIMAGNEADGTPLYICRTSIGGGVHAGKTRRDWGGCDIGYGGSERFLTDYEVLVPAWVSASGGTIPPGAMALGIDPPSAPLYTCRASYAGGIHPGKIRSGWTGCNIPYGGTEIGVSSYDVLVNQNKLPLQVVGAAGAGFPRQALVGGYGNDGVPFYLCLASYGGGVHPGKLRADWGSCDIPWGGHEVWVTSYSVVIPQFNAAPLGLATHPYQSGYESGGSPIGSCRVNYGGGVQVGKYHPFYGCDFGWGGGHEISIKTGFEILSTYVSADPLVYNIGWITFPDLVPVGGPAKVTLNADGSFVFSGYFHDSGFPCYDYKVSCGVRDNAGKVYTFSHSGSVGGTICGGDRTDSWNVTGSNAALVAGWEDLRAGSTMICDSTVSLDWGSLINDLKKDVETAVGAVAAVIAII